MLQKSLILRTIELQKDKIKRRSKEYKRNFLSDLDLNLKNHALIISGIRRCGKSTILYQLIDNDDKKCFFLNFDTPKLYNFDINDFSLIDDIISEKKYDKLFFDEIQVVKGWELYIRQKLDEGYQITISGSNASLLSKELGTKLTGRHITKELYPFSFNEYCDFKKQKNNNKTLSDYLKYGGFPEYLKTKNNDIHATLINDIIYRDIAVRYRIRDEKPLKHLITYMASNVGNLMSATKLKNILSLKSTSTILEYINYLEQSYLIHLMPKFSFSYKVQLVNPKKIYFIDNGLLDIISNSFSDDNGHKLENMVFWELKRKQKELFYYNENNKECDFVVCKNNKVESVIQVCYELNNENNQREVNSLLDAMDFFKLDKGLIITYNQHDKIINKNKTIEVVPAYEYFGDQKI